MLIKLGYLTISRKSTRLVGFVRDSDGKYICVQFSTRERPKQRGTKGSVPEGKEVTGALAVTRQCVAATVPLSKLCMLTPS